MVNRTLATLDLNPLLIDLVEGVGDLVSGVVGVVDGLLGSVLSGTTGEGSTIVGDYKRNMTDLGVVKELGGGLTQRSFLYEPLGSLVNIVFNTLGQVVQAVVVGKDTGGGSSSSSSSVPTATATTTRNTASTQVTSTTAV
ncbi:hypothetical protein BT67DRAFT_125497 [Trichocladium antarcticum]|uniref:Uncharacterized protein n=1 Tax=Trichocladium antarcticum TaxID=1450529 RepID=A0AAN6URK6_9PEZI|nr:hypothetical protein BT67DRAFT_125497 [Trichocladium antarcticum]